MEPILFEIHCTLSKGPFSIDMFVNLLLHPGPIQEECSLRGCLAAAEDDSPELFPVLVGPAAGGSTIINVFGRQDIGKCFKLFSSGKNMTFRLLSASDQLIVKLSLPNDDGFRKAYYMARTNAEGGPRDRTVVGDVLEEVFRGHDVVEEALPEPDDDKNDDDGKTEPVPEGYRPFGSPAGTPTAEPAPPVEPGVKPKDIEPKYVGAEIKSKFSVTHVSETFSGRPLLHIEPAPLSQDGWPDLNEELEQIIAPYIKDRDNIKIRYIDEGLPTTCTAVMSSVVVERDDLAIDYAVRTMVFETVTGKYGCNVHIRPEFKSKLDRSGNVIEREKLASPPVYDFREVYDTVEQSRDDFNRLIKIADRHFRNREGIARTQDASGGGMSSTRVTRDFGPWETIRGKFTELNREYYFTNLGGPGIETKIELRCRLTVEEDGARRGFFKARSTQKKVKPFVYLVVNPYLVEQTKFVAAFFAPSDDLLGYEILNAKVEAAASGVNFIVFDISDGEQLLKVLMLGRQITLRLIDPAGSSIASVPLENDATFRIEYESLKSSLEAND